MKTCFKLDMQANAEDDLPSGHTRLSIRLDEYATAGVSTRVGEIPGGVDANRVSLAL